MEVREIHVSRLLYLEGAADAAEAGNMHVKVKPHSHSLLCLFRHVVVLHLRQPAALLEAS